MMWNLSFISEEDIHFYSIDEVFMDVSHFKENYMVRASEIKDRIERA